MLKLASFNLCARLYTLFFTENFILSPEFRLKKENGVLTADWCILETDGIISGYSVADTGMCRNFVRSSCFSYSL